MRSSSIIPFYGATDPDLFGVERRSMDRAGRVIAHLDALLPPGRVLDLGAGDGWTASRLAGSDREVVAVEPAPGMRAQAGPHPQVVWVGAEAGALPLADGSLDAAYATWAYFFPSFRDPSRGLAELHRVVRPGGPIVVVDNAGSDELTALGTASGGEDTDWFTARGFTIEVLTTTFDLRPEDPDRARDLLAMYVGGADRLPDPLPLTHEHGVLVATAASTGPPALRVRAMRDDEAPEVGRITLAAYDGYGDIGPGYRPYLADPLARRDDAGALLVAVDDDGRVLGTVSYVTPNDEDWEDRPTVNGDAGFRVLAVDPDAEGRGVATALVDACFDRAREAGAHRMLIVSMDWMHRAHDLYRRRYGFVRRPDLDVRFPSGGGVIFTRDLSGDAPSRFPPPGQVPADPPWFEDVWAP